MTQTQESGIDVATGDNLTSDQRAEFMDLAKPLIVSVTESREVNFLLFSVVSNSITPTS